MSSAGGARSVHFNSPAELVERLDAFTELFDTGRTDVLIVAIRRYVQNTAEDEASQRLVAERYYDDWLSFEEAK